ncbi:MAG TPA: ImmA/IrrE family metallo-endopeptidase [Verrucomicrobiae bacterium]
MNGKEAIWEQVETFRKQYLRGDLAHLPVDVFTLAEIDLKLDIIPFDDLFEKYDSDAALMHDFTGIYVDAEAYIVWEKGPRWKQRRLRFSVAHELGHFILHREIAAKAAFKNFGEFAAWTKGYHSQQYTLEQAANEFAGRLLVPPDRLTAELERFKANLTKAIPNLNNIGHYRHAFADAMENVFEVNDQVIETRLEREGIWPAS